MTSRRRPPAESDSRGLRPGARNPNVHTDACIRNASETAARPGRETSRRAHFAADSVRRRPVRPTAPGATGPPCMHERGSEVSMAPTLFDATTDAITVNLNSLWLIVAAALVLLMTPGVAFFYGGMVKAKSVISMMMMSFGAIALVAVLWVLYGYSMSLPASDWLIPARPAATRSRTSRLILRIAERRRAAPATTLNAHARVRGLPGDLRDHHGRADLGRHRRPREVRRLDGLRGRLGDARLLPGRQLGVQLHVRRATTDGGWSVYSLRRQRLRRRHRGAHQRRCGGPRARDRARQARRVRARAWSSRTTCR